MIGGICDVGGASMKGLETGLWSLLPESLELIGKEGGNNADIDAEDAGLDDSSSGVFFPLEWSLTTDDGVVLEADEGDCFGLGNDFLSSEDLLSDRGRECAVGGSGAGATDVIGGGKGTWEEVIMPEDRDSGGGVVMLWNGDPNKGIGGVLSKCSGTGLGFIFT